ncbi:MAG: ribonuclease H family protein, partial [Aeromonas sp.]
MENEEENICNRVQGYLNKNYYGYLEIYTDGSKDPSIGHVGVGINVPEFKIQVSKRLPNNVTIYTAELVAVYLGLQWVEEVKPDRVVIFSDSATALESII